MFNLLKVNTDVKVVTVAECIAHIQSQPQMMSMMSSGDDILQVTYQVFAVPPQTQDQSIAPVQVPQYTGPSTVVYKLTDGTVENALNELIADIPELVITIEDYVRLQYEVAEETQRHNPGARQPAMVYLPNPFNTYGMQHIPMNGENSQIIPITVNCIDKESKNLSSFPIITTVFKFLNIPDVKAAKQFFADAQTAFDESHRNHSIIDLLALFGKGEFELTKFDAYHKLVIGDRTLYIRNVNRWVSDTELEADAELKGKFDQRFWNFCAYAEYVENEGAKYYNTFYEFIDEVNKTRNGPEAKVGASILPSERLNRHYNDEDED